MSYCWTNDWTVDLLSFHVKMSYVHELKLYHMAESRILHALLSACLFYVTHVFKLNENVSKLNLLLIKAR